ncbi:hypothetical protein D9M72_439250 [compost metagenome]
MIAEPCVGIFRAFKLPLEFGQLPIKELDSFLGFSCLALYVLAHVLGTDLIECALEAVAVAVFERSADHIRLLALFGELKTFLKIFGSGEQ